jgi:hypothetical protein
VEVDGEVGFACSRSSDGDDAYVLSSDVFPLDVVGRIVVMCLTADLVVPVFRPIFQKLTGQTLFFLINENSKSFALFQKKTFYISKQKKNSSTMIHMAVAYYYA